ncbi:SIMPL domain-containing protein [Brevibacillus migulae]|uniref:SIMPL domain-containing protein n=1 Tax=Brevibacillus migulae TaxID=1644114 RepID=UPI00106DF775|nr:SIMPL domain-containing protein [Brevibacillus migulae]
MKQTRWAPIFLTAGLLFTSVGIGQVALPDSASAAQDSQTKQIAVTGQGSITIKPDVVYVQFGVETSGKTANEAVQKNAQIFEGVKAAIKQAGVADADIQTVQFNTYPIYQDQKLTGYRVQNIVRVTYRDVDHVGKLLDQLAAAGVNRVESLAFSSEKMDEYEKQALSLAVKDARSKADALAAAAGVRIRGVVSMTESGAGQPPVFYMQRQLSSDLAAKAAETEISPGQLKVEATVQVVYGF